MADFGTDHHYDLPPAALQAVLSDGDYLAAKFTAIGFTEVSVVSASPERTEVKRTTDPSVPGWAKVIAGKQHLTEVHVWRVGDAPHGDSVVSTAGAPVKITATMDIEPDGDGSMLRVRGEAKASVPLIGGKLARLVADEAAKSLDTEYGFTKTWIAEH